MFDYCVEICFGIDILIKFITAFYHEETGELVTNMKEIPLNYLFSWRFVIDFASTFPLYLFLGIGEITKIFRLIRLPKAASLFDSAKFESCIECIMKSKLYSNRSQTG